MEAIKRQANKLKDQVSQQQQALLRQFGHFGNEAFVVDEAEIACRDQLHKLYASTREAKHFEKSLVHGIEGITSVTSKQIAIDCCRYGAESHCSTSPLTEAAARVGTSHSSMVEEKETMLAIFDEKVCKSLQALVRSAELEDARLLVRRYDKLWQEVEAQAADVLRLRSKSTEGAKSEENSIKLENAEEKLDYLKSRLMALGKEATSAMLSVEAHQQKMTFHQLVVTLNAERSYHRNVLAMLEKVLPEIIQLEQLCESSLPEDATESHSNGSKEHYIEQEDDACYVAKVVHPFDAQAEGELSLLAGDIVVVQQVIPGGWSKGECNGKTGWFPTPYVQRLDEVSEGNVSWANL
ncbi:SH3 domain-containing protein 2-like isoform X2 [Chenopodium quinoa]|uniref:SH3 domain-containing protein 2-like isoform X2 n=1 Tax=Chenopodium quinoa TaxID=63459 RepID=UPI000B782E21|nr:SH3 domain-containing protein 2-like isoform X2 [Chenopodium quinoa]